MKDQKEVINMKDQIETFSFSLPKGVKTISDHNVKNIRDLDEYIDEMCSVSLLFLER